MIRIIEILTALTAGFLAGIISRPGIRRFFDRFTNNLSVRSEAVRNALQTPYLHKMLGEADLLAEPGLSPGKIRGYYSTDLPKEVDDEINAEISRLREGYLHFECPGQMVLGKKETLIAEIFRDKLYLQGLQDTEALNEIKVGKTMSVKLTGSDFEITATNSENQLILPHEITRWQWQVIPLKHGDKKLELIVTFKLKIDNGNEFYDFPIFRKDILVRINRLYIARLFWEKNWQWIISTIVGSGVLLAVLKYYKIVT